MYTDYYQGLAARNQLLNVNDNIINRQYRIERQCSESDVVNTKDGHAFVIFNGGCRKFDKGTSEIYDKSDNLGFILGYEKSCNENLTLGAFAGYSNTDYTYVCAARLALDGGGNGATGIRNSCNINSGIFGMFVRYLKEKFAISSALSGSLARYETNDMDRRQLCKRDGYAICCSGDVRYNFSTNKRLEFGPLVAMSYSYINEDDYQASFIDGSGFSFVKKQFGNTLFGEVGIYGIVNCCASTVPVKIYGSVTFAGEIEKADNYTAINLGELHGKMYVPSVPNQYVDIKLGVTSAVSKSIDLNADIKGSFAKDYYDIMGAVGMSYNF